ncbi:MAG TPA: ATP-binding cassette domain-containing protein [Marmoricola sp.]
MTGLAISTRRLVHIYRTEGHDVAALSGVDLEVRAGEMIGLLGPSGAGKSTLLTLIGGLFRPSAGKIVVGADELSNVSPARLDVLRATEISLMLQGAARNLLPYLSPLDNVRFAQRAALDSGKDLPPPEDVLGSVGLSDLAEVTIDTLTPGHRQLLAVAVATASLPGVLLADEPTSQLEHEAADRVLTTIETINAEHGTTVVLVTHNPAVATRLPRTVTIRDGKIGGEGRSGEEYAVVTADGFVPLPSHAIADLPPGTLLRVHREGDHYVLIPDAASEETP